MSGNKTFKTGHGLKIQERDHDKLHFEDAIRDRTATGGIVSGQEPKNALYNRPWFFLFLSRVLQGHASSHQLKYGSVLKQRGLTMRLASSQSFLQIN